MKIEKLLHWIMVTGLLLIIQTNATQAQLPGWEYLFKAEDIRQIREDGNFLWIATQTGLLKMDKGSQQVTYFNTTNSPIVADQVSAVLPDGSGGVWIGTFWDGLMHYDGTNWELYNDVLEPTFPDNTIQDLFIDGNGHLWVGFWGNTQGLCEFDGTNWTFHNISCECVDMDGDSQGNLWVTCYQFSGGGVQMWDGSAWSSFTTSNSTIPTNAVERVSIDANDNVWVTTNQVGEGLLMYDGSTWTQMTTSNSNIPADDLIGVLADGSDVYVGTSWSGVAKFDGATWSTMGSLGNVSSILKDGGGVIWTGVQNAGGPGSYGGFHKWNGSDWDTIALGNAGLPNNMILDIATQFDKGIFDVWVGTQSGIAHWDSTTWTSYTTNNSGLLHDAGKALVIDDLGRVWAGTEYGIARFDGANWDTWTNFDGLPGNSITALAVDDNNNVWIGTAFSGISYFDGTTFTNQNTSNGVPSDYITTLSIDSAGNLWVGTSDNGVGMYDGSSWTNYNTSNSDIPGDDITAIAHTVIGPVIGTNGYGVTIYRTDSLIWQTADFSNSDLKSDYILSVTVMDYNAGNNKMDGGTDGQTVVIGTDNGAQHTNIIVGHHGNPLLTLAELLVGDSFYTEWQELTDRVNAASGVVDSLLGKRGVGTNYYLITGSNNGLMVNSSLNINFNPTFGVSGTVYLPDGITPVDVGFIQIVESGGTLLDTCHIMADGTYSCDIENVPLCEGITYYIYAYYPDPYTYMPTSFGNTVDWKEGVYFEACESQTGKDIILVPYPTGPTGPGNIIGIVRQGNRPKTGKVNGEGDPMMGVDVFLINKHTSATTGYDTTDAQGLFAFNNVPEGTYGLLVSFPGIPVDTLFSIDITAAGETVEGITVTVDSNLIHFNLVSDVGTPRIPDRRIRVSPNPFQERTWVTYRLSEPTDVEMQVYTIDGMQVLQRSTGVQAEGVHAYPLDLKAAGLSSGLYLLKVQTPDGLTTRRLVFY